MNKNQISEAKEWLIDMANMNEYAVYRMNENEIESCISENFKGGVTAFVKELLAVS